MHESGIAQRVIEVALERAREVGAARITDLHLEMGPEAGMTAAAVAFHVEEAARGTIAQGARLHIVRSREPGALRLVSIDVEDPPDRTA